jgi:hypothetical protein
MIEQLHQEGHVDDQLIWRFRQAKGSFALLGEHIKKMSKEELDLLLGIVYHEGFHRIVTERIGLLTSAFPNLDDDQQKRALEILCKLGKGSPDKSRDWRRVHDFMVEKSNDPKLGDLARHCYIELGTAGEAV